MAGPPPAHAPAGLDDAGADDDAAGRPPPRGVGPASIRRLGRYCYCVGREGYGRPRAQGLQARLLEAATEDVPDIVSEMRPVPALARRAVARSLRPTPKADDDTRRQLHASLGLLPVDRGQVDYLRDRLLTAGPQEVLVIREALQPHAAEVSPRLWKVLEDGKSLPGERLRAACALAAYAPDDARWQEVSRDVAARLVAENGLAIARWAEALRPVRRHLLPPLAALLVEDGLDAAVRRTITGLYRRLRRGSAGRLRRRWKRKPPGR